MVSGKSIYYWNEEANLYKSLNYKIMKTKEFINLLEDNPYKELLFEYTNGKFAGANYHLTEVKNVFFDTVDCGGRSDSWKETHLQLWESPKEIGKTNFMTADKIQSILHKVDSIKPLNMESSIKIEYGNTDFHTSIMNIEHVVIQNDKIEVKLYSETTLCKAIDNCGIPQKEEVKEETCCTEVGCC
jgi:hypothetical protein